ncbi:MAG: hypothetical protein K0R28_4199 [Paenibacillus sp.]|nr:hypothetical protein [Paenibacillus sp.]
MLCFQSIAAFLSKLWASESHRPQGLPLASHEAESAGIPGYSSFAQPHSPARSSAEPIVCGWVVPPFYQKDGFFLLSKVKKEGLPFRPVYDLLGQPLSERVNFHLCLLVSYTPESDDQPSLLGPISSAHGASYRFKYVTVRSAHIVASDALTISS